MDGHRFDNLTRSVAGPGSRRTLLRDGMVALAAALLGLAPAAGGSAHHTGHALGKACRHTNQCLHHAAATRGRRSRPSRQAVYCADNGFRYDGPLNCCHNGGGSCDRDEQCCGSRHFCRNRVCTYLR